MKETMKHLRRIPSSNALTEYINSMDKDFTNPLILALKNKQDDIVRMLLDCPEICINIVRKKYGTPFHLALKNTNYPVAQKLMKKMDNISFRR